MEEPYVWYCCPRCGHVMVVEYSKTNVAIICPSCKSIFHKQEMRADHTYDGTLLDFHIKGNNIEDAKQYLREKHCFGSPHFNEYDYNARAQREHESTVRSAKLREKLENQPKCISCGSTNLKKITVGSKAGSVLMWGVFAAGRTSKTYHCNNCGTEW